MSCGVRRLLLERVRVTRDRRSGVPNPLAEPAESPIMGTAARDPAAGLIQVLMETARDKLRPGCPTAVSSSASR